MSQVMKIPPVKSGKAHHAAAIFTIPESFLKQNIRLFVGIKNDTQF
jgi:hypothetical protein